MDKSNSESIGGNSSLDLKAVYLSEYNLIKIIVDGIYTVDTNDKFIEAAIALTQGYNTYLILLDMRRVYFAMNYVEVYDLPERNKQLGVPSHYRVAILHSPNIGNSKILNFFENRAVVRDLDRKIFNEENDAIDWLLQK